MRNSLNQLLAKLDMYPVLVDVGASGLPPRVWRPIARHSVYLGFDPDRRDLHETSSGAFHQSILVNKAITERDGVPEVRFYFTKQPLCSSSLRPDAKSLSDFLFADLFVVEREGSVPAETLNSALAHLGLDRIDWLKIDTQGTDLRIWRSLRDKTRASLLALEIEPGLIDAYEGEDHFVDSHRELTRNGFWLSNLNVRGTVRMRKRSLEQIPKNTSWMTASFVEAAAKKTPAWVEARYLRTIDSLVTAATPKRDFALLWVFAMLDDQAGFALDLAIEYERLFGQDEVSNIIMNESTAVLHRRRWRASIPLMKSLMPASVRRWIRNVTPR